MGLWLFITFFIFHFHSNASAARSVKQQPDSRHSFPPEARNYLAWLSHVESLGSSKTTSFDESSSPDGNFTDQSFVTVSQTPGAADFESIQAAIDSVPKGNTRRIVIQIAAGTYR
jgi:pectin methylesterase-like acyl-CoA thioesterase